MADDRNAGAGFQPLALHFVSVTQGVALGWDNSALSALFDGSVPKKSGYSAPSRVWAAWVRDLVRTVSCSAATVAFLASATSISPSAQLCRCRVASSQGRLPALASSFWFLMRHLSTSGLEPCSRCGRLVLSDTGRCSRFCRRQRAPMSDVGNDAGRPGAVVRDRLLRSRRAAAGGS